MFTDVSLLRNIISIFFAIINIIISLLRNIEESGEGDMQKLRPDLNIGGNIQKIRYDRKLTQDQVIAKMNLMGIQISKSTYAKPETNRMNIKVSELVAMKKIFDCEFGDFFAGLEN